MTQATKDIQALLMELGRASTPSVPTNPYGHSLASMFRSGVGEGLLTQGGERSGTGAALVVLGSSALFQELERLGYAYSPATPGFSHQQFTDDDDVIIVIDRQAFFEGPWVGVESSGERALREEAYELARKARSLGRPVVFLETPIPENRFTARVRSATDLRIDYDSSPTLEEGANVDDVHRTLIEVVRDRFDRTGKK